MIRNPILPGFNPDPSIVRVGADYYIATSTFEWFPGVQIHHSRDLVHWRLLSRPLNRPSQLNMLGAPDSCGVWAPCLTHADGLFYLIYTDVKRYGRTTVGGASGASLRDFHNYLVTCDRIDGEWSDPVHLNSSGFDPSLFHDDDGRKYLLNMLWDHRPGRNRFAGIVAQEYCPKVRALIGDRQLIFKGTPLGLTEAPHLYKRDGWYYLLTAEGGTGWNHAVTMARSRNIAGPYELHPETYILSSRTRPDAPLQRAGHADLVETADGDTYAVYLCGRPLPNRGRCILGRETAIQRMVWGDDGWLRTVDGQGLPSLTTPSPGLPSHPFPPAPARTDFEGPSLPVEFQWLRSPYPDELFSLTERSGWLRLFGCETIGSQYRQALVARRLQSFCASIATRMDFEPSHFQQAAGLVCYYGGTKFHYLHVSHEEGVGKHLRVMSALPDSTQADAFTAPIALPPGPVTLRAEIDYERLRFAYRLDGSEWVWLPQIFDASILSDEATSPGAPNFTGAFVGMACQDMAGTGHPADFDWFDYIERDYLLDPA
ncbi:glycoside hydrolase family 43 protein [Niveispirillum cyanobacteriorum]|uniref:Glycoside hydrolase 43 family protein n=1 Tax=Niveispirillum cyanobacteriorum TaxID=1612173 RepID=A0A2K9NH28_9PROT|nr:glycoside hydrolase family 43 protein [Niveispirillum cyanobacteriorum]AUN32399.1 glycoside hydrolase 43 family protein [Niveispirillum cyanobacteriorum]GGE78723.1 xylan 1,4-beta-xylosidase [Niveispirillum cyanobacteriorum]